MAVISRFIFTLLLAGVLLGAAPGASRAEEPPVVKTMLDAYALNLPARPTYQSIETGPDGTITIKGFSFGASEGVSVQYDIETMTLKGVSEAGGRGFEVANADYAGTTFKIAGEMVAAIPAINMSGFIVRAVPDSPSDFQKAIAASGLARETDIPQVIILVGGKSLTIENIHFSFEGDAWAYDGTQHISIGRVAVPQEILAMAGDQMPLKQLGYKDLEFSSDSTVKVNFTPENLSFAFDMGLTGKDMGTLRISANIADVPFALIEAARAGKDKADPEKLAALANDIAVSDLSVGFADASLTNRLLDFFSASQKMGRAQLIASAAASVQLGLTDLKNQDFTNKVITAVNTFLAAPGSLRVVAATAPVKVQQLLQSDGDPVVLLRLLQVDVQANQ